MKQLISLFAIILLIVSCGKHDTTATPVHKEVNSVYYWKTNFELDSTGYAFLNLHRVGRMYLRMFDVIKDEFGIKPNERSVPNATVRINHNTRDSLKQYFPDMEIVPVVYITLEALKGMKGEEGVLAQNIAIRVRNMCSYHDLHNVTGLQLDCDWTASTQQSFFTLCELVRKQLTQMQLPWQLSSTIRLHQLNTKTPPVDYGVLMAYNTGDFAGADVKNSILDAADVRPYMKYLDKYALHLDVAYPTYNWQLRFHNNKFAGLMNGVQLNDTALFSREKDNLYRAKVDVPYNTTMIWSGDLVREEASEVKNILEVKGMIDEKLKGKSYSNVLYHLDMSNLSNYTINEIERIYAGNQ